jgi:hypothetical protein
MTRSIPDQARLDFALTLRQRWADSLYPRLRAEYDVAGAGKKDEAPVGDTAAIVHALPSYDSFAWLERGSQKLLWRAVSDAVDHEAIADYVATGESTLTLLGSDEL